jgi:hypothetical protein
MGITNPMKGEALYARFRAICEVPPESGGETQFTKCGLNVKPRAGMGRDSPPGLFKHFKLQTEAPEKEAGYTSIKVGIKVKGRYTPGAKIGDPGCSVYTGTVTELTSRGTAKVLMDQGGINEYDINKAGHLSLTLT